MDKIDQIIEYILSDRKISDVDRTDNKIYRDKPILKRGSEMSTYVPPKIREMKKLERKYWNTRERFYYQGKLMEDYTDNLEYKRDFPCYLPTYSDFNTQQLRGYFTWRTAVRQGELKKTALAFVYVYAYELINQIGVKSVEDGYRKLVWLCDEYSKLDERIDYYADWWQRDYVIYYGLGREYIDSKFKNEFYDAVATLHDRKNAQRDQLFDALATLSGYGVQRSRFYKEYSEDYKTVALNTFMALCEHYHKIKKRKNAYMVKLFGGMSRRQYYIFDTAVFFNTNLWESRICEIDAVRRFVCREGSWKFECSYARVCKSQELGAVMKGIDILMRQRYNYRYKLKEQPMDAVTKEIINSEIDNLFRKKRELAAPRVELDLSKLDLIRTASDITRDRLIVDEEEKSAIAEEAAYREEKNEIQEKPEIYEEAAPVNNNTVLSGDELEFLRLLAEEKPYADFLRSRNIMESMIADSINEKLFDEFSDTVIEFRGDKPVIVEDYLQELKGLIK